MLKEWQFWVLTLLAGLGVAVVAFNVYMFTSNRTVQSQINAQAQYVQQTQQLEVLYREIVKSLADLSLRNDDSQLRDLLAAHGITVNANGAAPNAAADGSRRLPNGKP